MAVLRSAARVHQAAAPIADATSNALPLDPLRTRHPPPPAPAPRWPARAISWLAQGAAADYCGEEIALRDEGIRRKIGLIT